MPALIKGKQIDADTLTGREIASAAPSADVAAGDSAVEGTANTLALSDHQHAVDTSAGAISTVNGGDAAVEGSGAGLSRRDHQHAVATGAAGTTAIGDVAAEGASASLARADHKHAVAAPSTPANVTKSIALAGTGTAMAREDHKHDVTTAAAVELTDSTNAEGVATSLARSDHTHAHGTRGGGTLHALATVSVAGFLSAADKTKLDNLSTAEGFNVKDSVRVATTAAGTLISSFEDGDTVDGIVLATGDRILLKDQASGIENGIYEVQASGAPVRTGDLDTGDSARSSFVFVDEGTANADSSWFCTTDPPIDTVGTHALTFVHFMSAGTLSAGAGLTKTGSEFNIVANGDGSITVNANDIQVGVINDVQHGDIPLSDGLQHAVVTTLLNGFMAAADKVKLNAIETGATAEVFNQELITTETINNSDQALADTLDNTPKTNASVVLYLNGVKQDQGAGLDYTISGSTITWLASSGSAVNLNTNDDMSVTYVS